MVHAVALVSTHTVGALPTHLRSSVSDDIRQVLSSMVVLGLLLHPFRVAWLCPADMLAPRLPAGASCHCCAGHSCHCCVQRKLLHIVAVLPLLADTLHVACCGAVASRPSTCRQHWGCEAVRSVAMVRTQHACCFPSPRHACAGREVLLMLGCICGARMVAWLHFASQGVAAQAVLVCRVSVGCAGICR